MSIRGKYINVDKRVFIGDAAINLSNGYIIDCVDGDRNGTTGTAALAITDGVINQIRATKIGIWRIGKGTITVNRYASTGGRRRWDG